jgi:hypothetical protein
VDLVPFKSAVPHSNLCRRKKCYQWPPRRPYGELRRPGLHRYSGGDQSREIQELANDLLPLLPPPCTDSGSKNRINVQIDVTSYDVRSDKLPIHFPPDRFQKVDHFAIRDKYATKKWLPKDTTATNLILLNYGAAREVFGKEHSDWDRTIIEGLRKNSAGSLRLFRR